MIVKAVTLFLIFIAVLAMFGRIRLPGQQRLTSRRCTKCGRLRIGKGPCTCGQA